MQTPRMFTRSCLIVTVLVGGIVLTSTLTFGEDKSVSGSSLVMGKYVQREFESFLKSPTTPSTVNSPNVGPSSVSESSLVMGKYVQREMESFLKSPTAPAAANTPTLSSPTSVSESNMIMGKYVQREFESFLKPKPQAPPEAVTGKELSTTPKEVTKIPEGPK